MSKKVRVTNIYDIVWPHVCAKCGETLHLKKAVSLENKLTTKIAKIDPQLEYYVCEKHAKWLAMANLSVAILKPVSVCFPLIAFARFRMSDR